VDNGFYLNHCTRALAVRTDIPHTSLNRLATTYWLSTPRACP